MYHQPGVIMRRSLVLVFAALAFLTAACGEGATTSGDGVVLRYGYQPGDQLSYDMNLSMDMVMSGTGDLELPTGNDFDATMSADLSARADFTAEEGPDPDTVKLTTAVVFLDGGGTIEGFGTTEEIPFADVIDQMPAIDAEVILDTQGEIIEMSVGGQTIPPGVLEGLGILNGSSGFGAFDTGQMFGPALPDGPVSVGTAWSDETSMDLLGMSIRTTVASEVTAVETVAGRETYRIESTQTTDPIDLDLRDLLAGIQDLGPELAATMGEGMTADDLDAMLGGLNAQGIELTMHMDRNVTRSTTWFDAAAGVAVRVEANSEPAHLGIEARNVPGTGDVSMSIEMTMTMTMELVD
jgi:hypothetical protein